MSIVKTEFRADKIKSSLSNQIRDHMRGRILNQEWLPGERIPSEFKLAGDYQVSRVTIRAALKSLESQGLIDIRHGSGAFTTNFGIGIRAGLQELRSISETIQELGFKPGIIMRSSELRLPTLEEATALRIPLDESVFYMERAITADSKVVAYSYDTIKVSDLTKNVIKKFSTGSVFKALDAVGKHPVRATSEIHAVKSELIGWGQNKPKSNLYIQLKQTHFLRDGFPLMTGSTYFVEGRFQFTIHRTI